MNIKQLRVAAGTFVVVLSIAATAAAQVKAPPADQSVTTLRLTLDDAVRRAVENNPDLAIVRLGTEVEAARVEESRGAFTPVFSSTFGHSSIATPPSSSLLGSRRGGRQRLVLVHRRPAASAVGIRHVERFVGSGTNDDQQPAHQLRPKPAVGLSVRIFAAASERPGDRRRTTSYTIAKRNQESSDLRFREAVVQTVAAVKQTYWTLKAALANVTVQQRSLELAEELARENKVRVDAGQNPPLDLVQAEAEVAQRRENLIRARTVAEDAEDALRRLIMNPADTTFWQLHIDPVEQPTRPGQLPDVDAALAKTLNDRYDLARAAHEFENARSTVEFYGNQRLPDIRVETSYRGAGLGGTQLVRDGGFPGVITGFRQRSFGDALGQVFTNDYPTWSLGVSVSYPIGQSYEAASMVRAEVEGKQAAQRIASLRLQAADTVRRAGRQIRSTSERIEAARSSATFAQQRLDAEQRRFEVGLSTTFLVTQAQRDLLEAQVNLLQNTLDYESALVVFEAVQLAPPLAAGDAVTVTGSSVVAVPIPSPRGIFRPGTGSDF